MVEMCDLILEHAADPDRLAKDPVVQAAAQRWIEADERNETRTSIAHRTDCSQAAGTAPCWS